MALETVQHIYREPHTCVYVHPHSQHYWPNTRQAVTPYVRVRAPRARILGDAQGRVWWARCPRPHRHQPGHRNNLLASLKALAALFPTALCGAGASHTNLWTARTWQCCRYEYIQPLSLLSLHLIGFKSFLFSTFLPRAITPWSPPVPPLPAKGVSFPKGNRNKKNNLPSLPATPL